jgi:hypothetical protein
MFKFAGAVVDFYDDPEFLEDPDAQKLLGEQLLAPEDVPGQPNRYFAVMVKTAAGTHRKFPIYSKAATAISGGYFEKVASSLPSPIRDTAGFFLKQAHLLFGLRLPDTLQEPFPAPETGRLVEWDPEPEPEPASQGSLVKVAEYAFMDRHRSMHCLEKVEKAVEIAKLADTTGVPVEEPEVWNYTPKEKWGPHMREGLTQREVHTQDPMLKEAFITTLGHIREAGPLKAPFLLYEFDKMAGYQDRYTAARGFIDPFFTFWGGFSLRKDAGVKEDVRRYQLETVARHPEMLKSALPEKFITKFLRDPKGCYEDATAGERKLLDFLADKVPSDVKESSTKSRSGSMRSALYSEVEKATKPVSKEQVTPSERPEQGGMGFGIARQVDEGL